MKAEQYDSIAQAVGSTPLVRLQYFSEQTGVELYAKIESLNPLGSVKDRVALAMVTDAEERGLLNESSVIIEPTSGNTGIGLAFLCARKGYRLILTMPESMSIERRKLLAHLGAELVLTPAAKGMNGAIAKAAALSGEIPGSWLPNQFGNPANPAMHKKTTGPEIWQQTGGEIDFFVAGVGTGGSITGCGSYLKEKDGDVQVVAVEPAESPVLSGGTPGPHKIQGIGAGFIPEILDQTVIDEIVQVKGADALVQARLIAEKEGILVGISSGASLCGALQIAEKDENKGKTVVLIFPDTGERYLSTELMES